MRRRLRRAVEVALSPLLVAALALVRVYRRSFHDTSPVLHRVADLVGVYPVIDHYHEPLIRPRRHLRRPPAEARRLPAIDLRVADQLELVRSFQYQEELLAIPSERRGADPYYENLAFPTADAETLHNVLRHYKPGTVIEVGSGESTKFAARALRLNAADGRPGELVCIEPYEAPHFEELGFEVVRARVEELEPSFFDRIGSGDVLFIDSSHVARPQGDVVYLFTEVVPRLASGVIVHVHDVFTPRDYPEEWINRRWLWDEQYVVEALLAGNERMRVLLAVNFLYHDHRRELEAACPVTARGRDRRQPGSLWLRIGH